MLGYAGMNRTLRDRDPPVRCNRTMRAATFEDRGLAYAGELAAQNLTDLRRLLAWNLEHEVRLYRPPSALVPWNSRFDLHELPNHREIAHLAARCGQLVRRAEGRLTFHPDYWCKPASDDPETRERAVTALEYHADWLDLLGLPRTPYYGVNVHIGATYGDKKATARRFREVVRSLSPGARARLTVENDDKPGLWSVADLVAAVEPLARPVPVVFDYYHHTLHDGGLTYREAFDRAATTWGDVRPVTHYSEPARLHGDPAATPQTHAETVSDLPAWLADRADVVVEADGKERAVFEARDRSGGAGGRV
jgi:UV DNA damage endonuclease